jgi:hypothetical protein
MLQLAAQCNVCNRVSRTHAARARARAARATRRRGSAAEQDTYALPRCAPAKKSARGSIPSALRAIMRFCVCAFFAVSERGRSVHRCRTQRAPRTLGGGERCGGAGTRVVARARRAALRASEQFATRQVRARVTAAAMHTRAQPGCACPTGARRRAGAGARSTRARLKSHSQSHGIPPLALRDALFRCASQAQRHHVRAVGTRARTTTPVTRNGNAPCPAWRQTHDVCVTAPRGRFGFSTAAQQRGADVRRWRHRGGALSASVRRACGGRRAGGARHRRSRAAPGAGARRGGAAPRLRRRKRGRARASLS